MTISDTTSNTKAAQTHIPANASLNATASKADKKADALKTPAHRHQTDARFEEDARDLHRILPASRKIYIEGSRPDIQVPMREITLDPTPVQGVSENEWEQNPPFYVYDTSGVSALPTYDLLTLINRAVPKMLMVKQATSRKCTTHVAALLRLKWNTLPFAKPKSSMI